MLLEEMLICIDRVSWPGTVLCDKSIFGNELIYPPLAHAEDEQFMQKLYANNYLFPVIKPVIYIYVYNNNNTYGLNHFEQIFSKSILLNDLSSDLIKQILDEDISVKQASKLHSDANFLKELNYFSLYSPKKNETINYYFLVCYNCLN